MNFKPGDKAVVIKVLEQKWISPRTTENERHRLQVGEMVEIIEPPAYAKNENGETTDDPKYGKTVYVKSGYSNSSVYIYIPVDWLKGQVEDVVCTCDIMVLMRAGCQCRR